MAGKLDHLKIKKAPRAFAGHARQINEIIDLLGNAEGGPGIQVDVAHTPRKTVGNLGATKPKEQPRGKMKFTVRPSAMLGIGVGGNGGGNTNITTVNAVVSDGQLAEIQILGYTLPGNYPTALRTNGAAYVMAEANGFTIHASGGQELTIPFSQLTTDMGVVEFTGCNSGSPANYLVIASQFY